ncbi:hypothetical protein F4823DRAFT_596905 [Ustulina deusta]|nr:hypothetical protein F4823DRAFT_596905 [Ustulina deusta]
MAAVVAHPRPTNPFDTLFDDSNPKDNMKDEWEDWDVSSDDDSHPASHPNGLLIDLSDNNSAHKTRKSYKPASSRLTQHRPVQLPRVKSRARQKAQNAKAGITLVTDMSQFRQVAAAAQQQSAETTNKNKFANTPALQALEGKQSSPSIGSFAWLRQKPGNAGSKRSMLFEDHSSDLSPDSRPILIGISVPSDEAGSHQVSPQTAVVETPMDMRSFSHGAGGKAPTPQQLRSVWSPDTEATESPYSSRRAVSSIYSQYTVFGASKTTADAPPVPALPATLTFNQPMRSQEQNDEDSSAPCTPFEEDDSPVTTRKSQKLKTVTASPESASSRAHGWWDHVMTPFTPQTNNPFKTQTQQIGSSSTSAPQEWWSGRDEKKSSSRTSHLTIITPANQGERAANTFGAITPAPVNDPHNQTHSEKAPVILEENQSSDAPPPYEYSKAHSDAKVAFYQPGVNTQPVPSPGPMTPGLPGTMTSQSGINLADIPLTPSGVRPVPTAVLPHRMAGSYRTGDHFYEARGKANKTERQRRRHEKEDVMARKVGGFWRGRGCIPEEGCFGRSGREGRKRRRVCLGILGGVIAAIILIVILVVVFTHKAMSTTKAHESQPAPDSSHVPHSSSVPEPTYWLNLTDFPPMPTGVLTVNEPKNTVAVSGCFTDDTPSTAWSCALPKEDQGPTELQFIFQVQFDNSTKALWNLTDEADTHEKVAKVAEESTNDRREFTTDTGFEPNPEPPSLSEMRFLGNTTDNIKSKRKEGEPTPFFISFLESVDKTVGPNMLTRRQGNAIGGSSGNGTGSFNLSEILPAPELNPDGTGAPAHLFPLPVQQPVRLFDRDLPTEHYGFYTYFDKKIYMANSKKRDPADEDGGVPIADATALVTFAQTRFLVKIWTRMDNATQLFNSSNASSNETVNPMPYPITLVEDMHGGDPSLKNDFSYGVLSNMEINTANATLLAANIGFQGTIVNGKGSGADSSLGGFDGGTGGCKCEWVNFDGQTS